MTILELTYKAIEGHDWTALQLLLSRMNILDYRKIQTELRTKILPKKENDEFWETYYHLITFKKQSFIATIVAIENLAKDEKLDYNNEHVKQISLYLHNEHPESILSIINLMLPLLKNEKQVNDTFDTFGLDDRTRTACILKQLTNELMYYCLFTYLKQMQDNKELIQKCCIYIMKKDNDIALNMVCILKEYFGLSKVRCPKTLNIEPFELSYIDRDKDAFMNVLHGKKPKL